MEDELSLHAIRSEIRIAQSVSVVRQMPTIIAGNAIGAGIAYYAIRTNQPQFAPEPILVCIFALLMPMAWSWLKLRTRPRPNSVSRRRINGIIIYSAALGFTWGALEAMYLSSAPLPVVAFATTAAGFLAAGSVAALFRVPQACLAYSAPMLVSGIVVASLSTDPNHWPLLMILVLMSAGVCGFLRANWAQFTQNVFLSTELAQTVDGQTKLLKEKQDAENALREANLRLQALAARDPLTGIANRRRFDEALQAELSRGSRNNSSLSLLLIDADDFKKLNDTHGHQLGDECLRLIADVMKDTFKRPGDVIGRYGGEEFAVILPETEPSNAYVLAERLRTRTAEAGSDLGLYRQRWCDHLIAHGPRRNSRNPAQPSGSGIVSSKRKRPQSNRNPKCLASDQPPRLFLMPAGSDARR